MLDGGGQLRAAELERYTASMNDIIAIFETALSKFDGGNFDSLSETDKILVTIWGIEADVNNGGFDQYYFNGAGDQAYYAPTALAAIGARQMAEIASRANALFGPEGPPRSWEERQVRLEEVTANDDQLWDSLDREFQNYPDDYAIINELHARGELINARNELTTQYTNLYGKPTQVFDGLGRATTPSAVANSGMP